MYGKQDRSPDFFACIDEPHMPHARKERAASALSLARAEAREYENRAGVRSDTQLKCSSTRAPSPTGL